MNNKTDLLNLTPDEFISLLATWGEPKYRAAQIQQWLYRELVLVRRDDEFAARVA